MIKQRFLADDVLRQAVQAHYALDVATLTFLPIGYDPFSALYRVVTADTQAYLLKTYRQFQSASVDVPRHLHAQGLTSVLVPLPTTQGAYHAAADEVTLVLFPYIAGRTAADVMLSTAQWQHLGTLLRQIHAVTLPQSIADTVDNHRYALPPTLYKQVSERHQARATTIPQNPQHTALLDIWQMRQAAIAQVLDAFEAARQMLHRLAPPLVLCHGDCHLGNVLVDADDGLHLIDWDAPRYAPAESDLIFFRERGTQAFWDAYGADVAPDERIYTYYGYRWLLQEILEYSDLVITADDAAVRTIALQEFTDILPTDESD